MCKCAYSQRTHSYPTTIPKSKASWPHITTLPSPYGNSRRTGSTLFSRFLPPTAARMWWNQSSFIWKSDSPLPACAISATALNHYRICSTRRYTKCLFFKMLNVCSGPSHSMEPLLRCRSPVLKLCRLRPKHERGTCIAPTSTDNPNTLKILRMQRHISNAYLSQTLGTATSKSSCLTQLR